jgi:EamA domain-containing membrane protein RarD
VFTGLTAAVVLRERVSRNQLVAVVLAIIGIGVLVR